MTAFSSADRDRLAKICGMFGSDHAGERAAAALKAATLLRERNVTWPDLLLPQIGNSPPPPNDQPPGAWREQVALCQRKWLHLTPWERGFIDSVAIQNQLSPKQKATLADIVSKLHARGYR